jgi:hypothetical protein
MKELPNEGEREAPASDCLLGDGSCGSEGDALVPAVTVGGHGGFLRHSELPVVYKPVQGDHRGAREASVLWRVSVEQARSPRSLWGQCFPRMYGVVVVVENVIARTLPFPRHGPSASDALAGSQLLDLPDCSPELGERLFFAMEDVCVGMKRPCVADVKLGTQTWCPGVSSKKVLSEETRFPPQRRLGLRMTGASVWRKQRAPPADEACELVKLESREVSSVDLRLGEASSWVNAHYGRGFCFGLDECSLLWALRLFFASDAPSPLEPGDEGPCASQARAAPLSAKGLLADARRGLRPDRDEALQNPAKGSALCTAEAKVLAASLGSILRWCRELSPWELYGSSVLVAFDAAAPARARAVLIDFANARDSTPEWKSAWDGFMLGLTNLQRALQTIALQPAVLGGGPVLADASVWIPAPRPRRGDCVWKELAEALGPEEAEKLCPE